MGRQLSFGNNGGKRTYVQPAELSKFDINAGEFIDAFIINGPTIGKLGIGSKTTDIQGGAIAGIRFILLQTVIDDGVEVMNYMSVEDNYGNVYDCGTKVAKPHSEWPEAYGNPKYLINYVNSGAYIQGIGFQQILG